MSCGECMGLLGEVGIVFCVVMSGFRFLLFLADLVVRLVLFAFSWLLGLCGSFVVVVIWSQRPTL